jgi:CubicO group peptidase (beta-lactamase class C family)
MTMETRNRAGRRSRIIAGILLAICMFFLYLQDLPVYFYRMVRWWKWDVSDYSAMPSLDVRTAGPPFRFVEAPNVALVASLFERNEGVKNFEEFLFETDTTSFVVIRNQAILYESYPRGNPYQDGYHSFSVAKSHISALIGLAHDEGLITDINDPITKYLPELRVRDRRFENITIRHLLTMSSGLQYTCPYCEYGLQVPWGDNVRSLVSPNLRDVLLNYVEVVDEPGQRYLYKAYDPQLLALILERVTGVSAAVYLQEKIWKPLHMEYPATWMIDGNKSRLVHGDLGLNAQPVDLAKFGLLFLEQGAWDGQQIISQDWVAQSTQPETTSISEGYYPAGSEIPILETALFPEGDGHVYYGYLWWIASRGEDDHDFWALGHSGQWIYVSPFKNLIIVRTGLNDGTSRNMTTSVWLKMFYRFAGDL